MTHYKMHGGQTLRLQGTPMKLARPAPAPAGAPLPLTLDALINCPELSSSQRHQEALVDTLRAAADDGLGPANFSEGDKIQIRFGLRRVQDARRRAGLATDGRLALELERWGG